MGDAVMVLEALRAVPGVVSVKVTQERAPFTYRFTVEGGTDEAVAMAIAQSVPSYTGTEGSVGVELFGRSWRFDRPLPEIVEAGRDAVLAALDGRQVSR